MVKCPSCGAGMRFDPNIGILKCDYCSSTMGIVEETGVDNVSKESEYFESTLFTCPNCGGEILSNDDTAVTFCSYCGSSVELQGRLVSMVPPSYVIPFKNDKETVVKNYKKYISKALFAPKYMCEEGTLEKLRGIYMPYWLYDFEMNDEVDFAGSKSHRSGDYIYTDHYKITTRIEADYQGTAFDASSTYADELSEAIAPYNIADSKPFQEAYISGFYADTADVLDTIYEQQAKDAVALSIANKVVSSNSGYKAYSVIAKSSDVAPKLKSKERKMAYFPVWFLATRHGEHVSYAVVNGQTGKVAADIPIDYGKYFIGSLILALPIILILNLLFTPSPAVLDICAIIFALISWTFADKELNLLYTREHNLDDVGRMSVEGTDIMITNEVEQTKKVTKKKTANAKSVASTWCGVIGFIMIYIGGIISPAIILVGFGLFIASFILAAAGASKSAKAVDTSTKVVYKQPFKEKFSIILKPLLAILAGVLLLIINPFIDMVYYIGVLVIMVLVLVSFNDVIRLHNKLAKRVPPQFGKRGGDE